MFTLLLSPCSLRAPNTAPGRFCWGAVSDAQIVFGGAPRADKDHTTPGPFTSGCVCGILFCHVEGDVSTGEDARQMSIVANCCSQTSDNDEYCSACGNAGDVVCCDGCPRSFHFECVDMVQSEDLPDEWYCNECLIRRFPSRVPVHKGIFASALNHLEKSIPRAFSLPKKVQNRFEGVKAGADGDYEDVVVNKTAK